METIYWKEVLKKIEELNSYKIDFKNEKIHWQDAIKLGKAGIEVPTELIDNEEKSIDYSEVDKIEEQQIELEELIEMESAMVLLTKENYKLLKESEYDLSEVVNSFLEIVFQHKKMKKEIASAKR